MTFDEWLDQNGYDRSKIGGDSKLYMLLYQQYKAWISRQGNTYNDYLKKFENGELSAVDFQGILANNGISVTPDQQQWINNSIGQQITEEDRDYNQMMRDTSLTSSAKQLSSLGLNPASVISTGGAGIGSNGLVDNGKSNVAQEIAMAKFNQSAQMTRTLIGLVGGLAYAGITGGAKAMAVKAAGTAASYAAHSGISALKKDGITNKNWERKWNELQQDLEY